MSPGSASIWHLTDCFAELMAAVLTFRQTAEDKQPAYDDFRKQVLGLLKDSEAFAANGFSSMDDYAQARYAVCAWIDESVLASSWNFKGRWRLEQLQRMYYQSADAGEKFFERLKALEPHQQGLREVFYLCLALGFKGRYCAPDDGYALEQLKERHLKLLFNSVSDAPSLASMEKNVLFPEAYADTALTSTPPKTLRRSWRWTAAIAGPALLFVVLFLTYRFTLLNLGEIILKAVRS